jgi:hypothetical protein
MTQSLDSGDDSNSAAAACSPSPSKQPPRGARGLTVSGTPACAPPLFPSMRRATDLGRTEQILRGVVWCSAQKLTAAAAEGLRWH